jgi:quercetin dioxygenase-like cupin family protein
MSNCVLMDIYLCYTASVMSGPLTKTLTSLSRPAGKINPTFRYELADNPSLTVVGLLIEYPPNGSTPPHRHGTASVIGYVIEGEILSAMNDEDPKCYKKGGSWYEKPGCHHRVSDNNSQTEKLVIHATFVIKTEILEKEGMGVLVQIDPEYLEGAAAQPQ